LPKKPAGQVKFDVNFNISNDNILTVTAKEKGSSGLWGEVKISNDNGRLTKEQKDAFFKRN